MKSVMTGQIMTLDVRKTALDQKSGITVQESLPQFAPQFAMMEKWLEMSNVMTELLMAWDARQIAQEQYLDGAVFQEMLILLQCALHYVGMDLKLSMRFVMIKMCLITMDVIKTVKLKMGSLAKPSLSNLLYASQFLAMESSRQKRNAMIPI